MYVLSQLGKVWGECTISRGGISTWLLLGARPGASMGSDRGTGECFCLSRMGPQLSVYSDNCIYHAEGRPRPRDAGIFSLWADFHSFV